MIAKNNIVDDLDSIYFFDKIKMRSNSASNNKIPKLDFNTMKLKIKKHEESQNNNYNNNNVIIQENKQSNQILFPKKVKKFFLIFFSKI